MYNEVVHDSDYCRHQMIGHKSSELESQTRKDVISIILDILMEMEKFQICSW